MTHVYKRLAAYFDGLPNGFPATESGVELKILQRIFSPEDAEMALQLKTEPETAQNAAQRLGKTVEEMRAILDRMAKKGQIASFKKDGEQVYAVVPFVIGMYELQLNHLDKDLATLFKEYKPTMMRVLGGEKPAVARVVPVNAAIQAQHQVLRFEDMYRLIEEANSFVLRECICRKQKALEGHSCEHTREACLGFSPEENAYDYFTYAGRVISKEEALQVLKTTADEGLVYCTYNVQEGQTWVCSCCICCCALLGSIKDNQAPYVLAGSLFFAAIDQETCSACGTCAEERCVMEAVVEEEDAYRVMPEECIGCGVCTITCPTGSIVLHRRPESEQIAPPKNLMVWNKERIAGKKG